MNLPTTKHKFIQRHEANVSHLNMKMVIFNQQKEDLDEMQALFPTLQRNFANALKKLKEYTTGAIAEHEEISVVTVFICYKLSECTPSKSLSKCVPFYFRLVTLPRNHTP